MEEIEVLLAYKGSRSTVKCSKEDLHGRLDSKLEALLGHPGACILLGQPTSATNKSEKFILQKYSVQWENYIDVDSVELIDDGDRLTVIPDPTGVQLKKSDGQQVSIENILSRVKAPTQAEASALAKCFGNPVFDPRFCGQCS